MNDAGIWNVTTMDYRQSMGVVGVYRVSMGITGCARCL